jgi:hypothetical protein
VVLRNGTENLSIGASGAFAFVNRVNEGMDLCGERCDAAGPPDLQRGQRHRDDASDGRHQRDRHLRRGHGPGVTYSIGGTVSGLDAGKTLQLRLQHSSSIATRSP